MLLFLLTDCLPGILESLLAPAGELVGTLASLLAPANGELVGKLLSLLAPACELVGPLLVPAGELVGTLASLLAPAIELELELELRPLLVCAIGGKSSSQYNLSSLGEICTLQF